MNKFQQYAAKLILGSSWEELTRAFLRGDDAPVISGQMPVTTEVAMKYSAVFACVRVLSETLAGMPIMLYRKTKDGRESVNDLPIYDVLHNAPNGEMSPFNFKEALMMSLNTGGNAYCEKLKSQYGDVVGLYPYQWAEVEPGRDKVTKRLTYKVRDEKELKTRDEIFHIPGLSFDGIIGLSPIEYAASAIRLGLSQEKFGNKFYQNGAHASGVFTFPNALSDPAFQRLKEDLAKNYTGMANAGKPILLEEGGTFSAMTIKPVDAQLVESKMFQIEDICRIYRVPQHLVNKLDRSTNNNIEHQSLEFVMYTMLPWFKRVEENINLQLLSARERKAGYYVEFKVDSLLRGDAKSRAEAYAAGRQWGWLSVNDIRKLENMPAIPNGDIFLTPANMYEAGKEPAKAQVAETKALADEIHKMIEERR